MIENIDLKGILMKYLLSIILILLTFDKLESMQPHPRHSNCTGCIISLITAGSVFEAYQYLCRFDSEAYDINISQGTEASLLHFYSKQTHARSYFFKILLAKGAHIELKDNATGETPLLVALRHRNISTACMLVEAGCQVKVTCNTSRKTPLHWLCMNTQDAKKIGDAKYYDLIKTCLAQDPLSLKEIAVMKVARQIKLEQLKMLAPELRIEILFYLLQNEIRFDPKYLTVLNTIYNLELFKQKLQKRVNPDAMINKQDIQGDTPLHIAARDHAPVGFALFLVRSGADRMIQNNANQTPLQVAQHVICNRNACKCEMLKDFLNQPQKVMEKIDHLIKQLSQEKK